MHVNFENCCHWSCNSTRKGVCDGHAPLGQIRRPWEAPFLSPRGTHRLGGSPFCTPMHMLPVMMCMHALQWLEMWGPVVYWFIPGLFWPIIDEAYLKLLHPKAKLSLVERGLLFSARVLTARGVRVPNRLLAAHSPRSQQCRKQVERR